MSIHERTGTESVDCGRSPAYPFGPQPESQFDELLLDYVRRLAEQKTRAVEAARETVVGADTTVVIDGQILANPENAAEAQEFPLTSRARNLWTNAWFMR